MELNQKALEKKSKFDSSLYQEMNQKVADYLKKGGKFKIKAVSAKSGIRIKKSNEGKFTKSANAAGQSVQEHAQSVLSNPNATTLQKRRAIFARNSAK